MIFLRYESFRSYLKFYPVTSVLLAINLVMFAILELTGGSMNTLNLLRWGAFIKAPSIDPFGLAEPWRYLSAMFLHIGWQHLLFNCFSLLVFAPPLERLLGHVRYFAFYILSGIAGSFLSLVLYDDSVRFGVSAGASGAIYGVFGAFLHIVLLQRNKLDEASRKTVITILVIGVLMSIFISRIDLMAHVGGGFAGFALYGLLQRRR
ncbi:rhomboid family intramembrane serine protease [Paenibacillus sp. 1P07SE]|uniref:rhomboid family intramembrane serine protease n=1 Tax=Paenibacillus sp. 1P07SE TaxID=3132209 RepID=UPI0039A4DAE0